MLCVLPIHGQVPRFLAVWPYLLPYHWRLPKKWVQHCCLSADEVSAQQAQAFQILELCCKAPLDQFARQLTQNNPEAVKSLVSTLEDEDQTMKDAVGSSDHDINAALTSLVSLAQVLKSALGGLSADLDQLIIRTEQRDSVTSRALLSGMIQTDVHSFFQIIRSHVRRIIVCLGWPAFNTSTVSETFFTSNTALECSISYVNWSLHCNNVLWGMLPSVSCRRQETVSWNCMYGFCLWYWEVLYGTWCILWLLRGMKPCNQWQSSMIGLAKMAELHACMRSMGS